MGKMDQEPYSFGLEWGASETKGKAVSGEARDASGRWTAALKQSLAAMQKHTGKPGVNEAIGHTKEALEHLKNGDTKKAFASTHKAEMHSMEAFPQPPADLLKAHDHLKDALTAAHHHLNPDARSYTHSELDRIRDAAQVNVNQNWRKRGVMGWGK